MNKKQNKVRTVNFLPCIGDKIIVLTRPGTPKSITVKNKKIDLYCYLNGVLHICAKCRYQLMLIAADLNK